MSKHAVMPLTDYVNVCDTLREKTGTTEPIKSGDIPLKVNDVYDMGKLATLKDSKYMNGKESGAIVSVNDVTPIEHNVGVKLSSDTITDFTGVEVARYGKNLLFYNKDTASTSPTNPSVQFIHNDDGTITVNGTANETSQHSYAVYVDLPAGDYILSGCPFGGGNNKYLINFAVHYNGVKLKDTWETGTGLKVNAPNGIDKVFVGVRVYQGMTVENLVFKPQLELGETATAYEPYIEPITYTANADGTVEGVKSISPNMTLIPNTSGVTVECEYLRDIDLYIDNLLKSVAMIGGE